MSPTLKRNPNDLTLRNLHALKKRLIQLTDRVVRIERGLKDQREWDRQVAFTLNRIAPMTVLVRRRKAR